MALIIPTRPTIIVPAIIVLNCIVFFMWIVNLNIGSTFMQENFLVSWYALEQGRFWVLLTSVFSHNMFLHIFINMFVLSSFGSVLELVLGRIPFLTFYLIAGVVSSFCHALVSATVLDSPGLPALGASGSVSGLVLIFSLLFPKEKILIFGLIPIPALFGAIAFIGFDIWGLIEQAQGSGLPIGHGAHLGGAFAGIVYYFVSLRGKSLN